MNPCLKFLIVGSLFALFGCVNTDTKKEPISSPAEAAQANFNLGVEYFKQNKLTQAYDKFKRSLSQDDTNPQANAFFAMVAEQLDQKEEARRHYLKALKINDSDPVVQNMYGAYLCREGKTDQAELHFLEAANNRFYGTPEAAFTNAGACVLKNQSYDKALDYLDKALKFNPKYSLALWHMANLHFEQDRDLQARAFLERLGQPQQLPPEALLLGYQIARRSNSTTRMEDYRSVLKDRFPDSTETTRLLEIERNGG
ncbi:MAG: type IV pilus biogenesis/stability protein PilW [Gammaproteobacteria bacterium]